MVGKFYPGAWYVPNEEKLGEWLGEFFKKHRHEYDESNFGGWQYGIAYDVNGDKSTITEQLFDALDKSK